VPFREAHRIVGNIVAYCIEKQCDLSALPLARLRSFHPLFSQDVRAVFSWEQALARREVLGGTGRNSVKRQIAFAKKLVARTP
jgi:argininosuccinate lyase